MTCTFTQYAIYDRKTKLFYRRGIRAFAAQPRLYLRKEDANWRKNDILDYRAHGEEYDLVIVPAFVEIEIDEETRTD